MKKMSAVLLVAVLVVAGCSGFQVTDTANNKAIAYVAGKGMAIGVYKVAPKSAPAIEQEWMDMMGRSYGQEMLSSAEMMGFFNNVLLKQIPTLKNDPYGLSGDLAFFLTIYGAEFTPDGAMTAVKPVPMPVVKAFQFGYEGGRSVAANLK